MFDSNQNRRRKDEQKYADGETSHSITLQSVNPWEQDNRSVSSARNCLILADRIGVQVPTPELDCHVETKLSSFPSMKLIDVQREITEKNKALHQVSQAIAALSLEVEITEFLHCRVIEKRMNMVNQLCSDLDLVLKNIDVLLHRFLKPFVGDHIRMDAAYHRCAKDVFIQLVPTLNDLVMHLNNITWAANSDFSSSHLESLKVQVHNLTASVQMSCHVLSQMNKCVEKLRPHTQGWPAQNASQDSMHSYSQATTASESPSSGKKTVAAHHRKH